MQIVIDITPLTYQYIEKGYRTADVAEELFTAVQKGTPLPKGHRFIDADEILNHAFITEDEEGDIFVQKYYCIKKEIMDNALVLFDTLEKDKEIENE